MHLSVRAQQGFQRDETGLDLDSVEQAHKQVHMLLPDLAREQMSSGEPLTITCDVRDQAGRAIYHGELTCRCVVL